MRRRIRYFWRVAPFGWDKWAARLCRRVYSATAANHALAMATTPSA